MMYSDLKDFKHFLEELDARFYTLQITRHKNFLYSACIVSTGGHQDFVLEHSRKPNTPRLFKSVTPIFSLMESVNRGGFTIEFIKHTIKDKEQLSLEV